MNSTGRDLETRGKPFHVPEGRYRGHTGHCSGTWQSLTDAWDSVKKIILANERHTAMFPRERASGHIRELDMVFVHTWDSKSLGKPLALSTAQVGKGTYTYV